VICPGRGANYGTSTLKGAHSLDSISLDQDAHRRNTVAVKSIIVAEFSTNPVLRRLASMWDEVVEDFIEGAPPWTDELRPWLNAYRGATPATKRVDDAMPEPFSGRLDRKPKAIMLALNPGNAFLGGQTWMGRQPMPDLQSRQGRFAQEIKASGGSYCKWARRPFDWPALNGGSPHPFVTSRMRFVNDWVLEDTVAPDEVVWFDLYPWHSKSWSSLDVRHADVLKLIDKYVAQPIAALSSDWTFAFGKPWFDVLPEIGFEKVVEISGASATWDNKTPSRVVGVFASRSSSCKVIAMRHSGSAGPPKQSEVASLRKLIDSKLESMSWD